MPVSQENNRDEMGVGATTHARRMKDKEFKDRLRQMFSNAEHLEAAVMEAIGAGSMCWNEPPSGHFDSTKAEIVALELIEWINERMEWKERGNG
jgi:hypothetical protein